MPLFRERDGKLSVLNLEYNIVAHCNFACVECSHLSPFMRREDSAIARFARDVSALAGVLRTDRFRFVGGEPLLHPGLAEHIAVLRASGLAREIHICTNGSLIDRIDDDLIDSLDQIAVSWYPSHWDQSEALAAFERRVQGRGRRLKIQRTATFRTMNMDLRDAPPELPGRVYAACKIAQLWSCQTFFDGRFYLCSRPLYSGSFAARAAGDPTDYREADGISLHAPDLLARLRQAYRQDQPLESCTLCLGTSGKEHPWRSLTPAERKLPVLPGYDPREVALPGAAGMALLALQRLARRAILWTPGSALVTRAVRYLTRRTLRDNLAAGAGTRTRLKRLLAGR